MSIPCFGHLNATSSNYTNSLRGLVTGKFVLYSLVVYEFLKGVGQKYQKIRQIGNHRVAQNIIYDGKETTYSQLQFARKSGSALENRLNLICSNLQQFSVHFAFASVYLVTFNLLAVSRIFYNCPTFKR